MVFASLLNNVFWLKVIVVSVKYSYSVFIIRKRMPSYTLRAELFYYAKFWL